MRSSHGLDRVSVQFDDENLVANAGLVLGATLAQHLGLPQLLDDHVQLGDAPGRANAGLKAMTIIYSALAGGSCIDDCDALRAGSTQAVLGQEVRAPSTLGTFLRSFCWGDARSLDRVSRSLLARAWQAGAGPRTETLTIDVDSTICETYGTKKEGGSDFAYTSVRGYHPLVAVASGTGEVLHTRFRGGPAYTARGAASFLRETFARVREAGFGGALVLRGDSGFYNHHVTGACAASGVRYSITAKIYKAMRQVIAAIPEEAWVPIPSFLEGVAVAETSYTPFPSTVAAKEVRLIVRRTPVASGTQLALYADYAHSAFITDCEGAMLELEADHRAHAEVENAIRDLKYGMGLNHLPSGRFGANAAWLGLNVMAHNLSRWVGRIGLGEAGWAATKTLRTRYFSVPGRWSRSGRRRTLHLPSRWPWAAQFQAALDRLRAIPLLA
jgi:hypothetical protein